MIQSIKSTISNKAGHAKDFFSSIGSKIVRKCRKHKKKCIGISISIAALMLLAGLIMGSFKWVSSTQQGVPINYSEGKIQDSSASNYGGFAGLTTYYYSVPATNFLMSFRSSDYDSSVMNTFKSISARVIEGIKMQLDVDAKVKLVPNNLKSFLEDYGMNLVDDVHAGWQIYIKEKIKNVVAQAVAEYKFYQLNNQAVLSNINAKFSAYSINSTLNYPFLVSIIGINIHYPKNTMELNDTLGVKLLKQTSLYQQLQYQLNALNTYLGTYQTSISNYASKQATIDGMITNREEAVKISSPYWIQGLQVMNSSLQNSTLMQKYLEIYFNSIYNVTYRLETITPFVI